MMMQDLWSNNPPAIGALRQPSKSAPCSPLKPMVVARTRSEPFHVAHKVPVGDTPYVKAKRVQLVDKDPDKAIVLFWAAINAGDRVDSALKDMAIVMKQQNRAEEAIEAIKSLRNRCSDQAQESLDNILLDLYKRCGRLDDQIALLKHKLHLIQQGLAFNGKRTKTARSQGRKFQVSVEQEATRILGNLGWALMQQENYIEAEAAYRRALLIGPDNNKMCNLGICLMKQGRVAEAKETLKKVRPAVADGPRGVDSHLKAFDRAQEMLRDLESKITGNSTSMIFDAALFGSSAIWQPQPCAEFAARPQGAVAAAAAFADENVDVNRMVNMMRGARGAAAADLPLGNSLNIDAQPYYARFNKDPVQAVVHQYLDPLGNLKRTRHGNVTVEGKKPPVAVVPTKQVPEEPRNNRRRSLSFDESCSSPATRWKGLLPDNKAFDEAIVAAVLAPVLEAAAEEKKGGGNNNASMSPLMQGKTGKRLRVFQDITQQSLSPRA